MKRIISIVFAVIISVSVFAKLSKKSIQLDELPAKAQTCINKYYSDLQVKSIDKLVAENGVTDYKVVFKDKTVIVFDMVGAWSIIDSKKRDISTELIPKKTQHTLEQQFSDKKLLKVSNDGYRYNFYFKGGAKAEIDAIGKIINLELK